MDMYRAVPVRLLCSLNTFVLFRVNSSVSDPDPLHTSVLFRVNSSVSDPDPLNTDANFRVNSSASNPDPGGHKLPIKVGKNLEISCVKVLEFLF